MGDDRAETVLVGGGSGGLPAFGLSACVPIMRPRYSPSRSRIASTSRRGSQTGAMPTSPSSPPGTRLSVADQETGVLHFHVLVDDDDRVIGRVNLVDVADGSAELGYRIAESATGRGLPRRPCSNWSPGVCDHGLTELRAGTSAANKASRTVLERTGFAQLGEPTTGDRPQVFYTRRLGS